MVIKLYISGISGNKEVKKKQQRVQMILDSKQINYEAIDITEPGKEKDKEFMQQNGKVRESLGKYPLPPQIFNDDDFCGDYEDFDLANEVDELEKFLHIETSSKDSENDSKNKRELRFTVRTPGQSLNLNFNPYEYHTIRLKCDPVNGVKDEIINSSELAGENKGTKEVTKKEVNGECETVPGLEPSKNLIENIEPSAEEVTAPKKEESSPQENTTEAEKEKEEKVEEKEKEEEEEVKEEAEEKEEKQEDVESPTNEEKVEEEEKAPPPEEKEEEEEEENDENEGEKEEEKEEEEKEGSEKEEEEKEGSEKEESEGEAEKSQED